MKFGSDVVGHVLVVDSTSVVFYAAGKPANPRGWKAAMSRDDSEKFHEAYMSEMNSLDAKKVISHIDFGGVKNHEYTGVAPRTGFFHG